MKHICFETNTTTFFSLKYFTILLKFSFFIIIYFKSRFVFSLLNLGFFFFRVLDSMYAKPTNDGRALWSAVAAEAQQGTCKARQVG